MKTSSEVLEVSAFPSQRYALSGETMGTRYSVFFFSTSVLDESAIGAGLFAAVDKVDRRMSTWKPDLYLNRLNAAALEQWSTVPEAFISMLASALRIDQQSDGAFDIGVGAVVNAWGFAPENDNRMYTKSARRRNERIDLQATCWISIILTTGFASGRLLQCVNLVSFVFGTLGVCLSLRKISLRHSQE